MRLRQSKSKGFILIEGLVGLAIFGATVALTYSVCHQGFTQTGLVEKQEKATWVAENRLSILRVNLNRGKKADLGREVTNNGGEQWVTTIKIDKTTDTLVRLKVDVALEAEPNKIIKTVTSYVSSSQ